VKEQWPDMPIHLSVQANTVNYATVKFWQREGIERIILSRELSLDEVEEIRQQCPDTELEVFVHGALCIAYSGRCLLSGYFNHRDPNQGSCTNSCRWDYKTVPAQENAEGVYKPVEFNSSETSSAEIGNGIRHPSADDVYLLEEAERPGEQMPILEDEHGTYIMNSKDLRAIEHVNRLVKIGVDCLKIEGRTKSHYYVARTTQTYRRAIDAALRGEVFNPALLGELENLANRGYTDGFFERHHTHEYQNYIDSHSKSRQQTFVGEILSYDADSGIAEIDVKNRFCIGDRLQLVTPNGNVDIMVANMKDRDGRQLQIAPGSGHFVRIALPPSANEQSLLARYI
jgi:putative protease